MREETAKRLFEYRKANGYSQEELAEKIGVSRQAISKWERGESSPDTDNLIALSRLYNITIDEMINSTEKAKKSDFKTETTLNEEPEAKNTEENKDKSKQAAEDDEKDNKTDKHTTGVSFRNGIHVHDGKDNVDIDFTGIHVETKNGESVHIGSGGVQVNGVNEEHIFSHGKEKNLLHALLPAGVIIAYLIIGFTFEQGWAIGWLLIFLIPIIESFAAAIKTKNPSAFAYPVLIVGIFLTVGMLKHIWHPTWIMFLTIPVYYIIADFFKPKHK